MADAASTLAGDGGLDHGGGDVDAVDAAATRGVKVKRYGVIGAQLRLDERRLGRHDDVPGDGHAHDEIDISGHDACVFEGGLCSLDSKIGGGLVNRDAAVVDAGALDNPFVARVDDVCQVIVAHDELRLGLSVSDDLASHGISPCWSVFAPVRPGGLTPDYLRVIPPEYAFVCDVCARFCIVAHS